MTDKANYRLLSALLKLGKPVNSENKRPCRKRNRLRTPLRCNMQ